VRGAPALPAAPLPAADGVALAAPPLAPLAFATGIVVVVVVVVEEPLTAAGEVPAAGGVALVPLAAAALPAGFLFASPVAGATLVSATEAVVSPPAWLEPQAASSAGAKSAASEVRDLGYWNMREWGY
jgi:hypothetical protein